jgi:hypothetical protein
MQFGEEMDISAARDYIGRRLEIDSIRGEEKHQIMARCLKYTTDGLDATYELAKQEAGYTSTPKRKRPYGKFTDDDGGSKFTDPLW